MAVLITYKSNFYKSRIAKFLQEKKNVVVGIKQLVTFQFYWQYNVIASSQILAGENQQSCLAASIQYPLL